ncbi:hypothetical protein ACHQM5_029780 [Ranunculus cassubicifolius]
MVSETLTNYERIRLENIKRNKEMMANLEVHSKVLQLSSHRLKKKFIKRDYFQANNSVVRKSLRSQGLPPPVCETAKTIIQPEISPKEIVPLTMQDAYVGNSSDRPLIDAIINISDKALVAEREVTRNDQSLDVKSMVLKPENVSVAMRNNVMNMMFFPSPNRRVIIAGFQLGNIGFWDTDCEDQDSGGIYLYQPHRQIISGISVQPFSLSKVYSSCYGGLIRLMDVGREYFDLVYSTDDSIFCLSQRTQEAESLYFAEGRGLLNVCDIRVGKCSNSWMLHNERINTIDFNPESSNLMATGSSDGTVCIWDLRNMNSHKPKYLNRVAYETPVRSAYFSSSGRFLATTQRNAEVGILAGGDYVDISAIYRPRKKAICEPQFRAIWGWDDSYLFIGNVENGVDVISTIDRNVATLNSSLMSSVAVRLAVHPYKVGTLAGATRYGRIFMWK